MIAGPVTLGEPNHETNYIAGGFAGGGCSNSARKKHLRDIQFAHATTRRRPYIPPITFTDDDFTAIDLGQDDPMVITVEINKFAIAKTLVDQGSSSIYYTGKSSRKCASQKQIFNPITNKL